MASFSGHFILSLYHKTSQNINLVTSEANTNRDESRNSSRRTFLIGLGGGLSISNNPFAFSAPLPIPDLPKCDLSSDCCPPTPASIIDFRLPPPPATLRIRPAAHLADQAHIEQFEKAVQLMKALPDSDPRSFKNQANVHCAYCDGAFVPTGFPNVPLDVHYSWLFYPWHRWYGYFFEKICGRLLNDPNFAMPFWNWDSPAEMAIPGFYTNPNSSLYDALRDSAHQPPNIIDMDFAGTDSGIPGSEQVSRNLTIMYKQMVSNSRTPMLFFGNDYRAGDYNPNPGAGPVENVPHNLIHTWLGDRTQPRREDMGSFYSAGRDPIFFAHHANLDRMWSIWKSGLLKGGRRRDITDTDWLDTSFLFYDENAQMVRVRVRDCLDLTRLGYRYQEVDIPWLSYRPTPKVSGEEREIMKVASANAAGEDGQDQHFPVKLDKTVKLTVKRPVRKRSKKEKDEKDEVLVVQDIATQKGKFVKFDVLINDDGKGGTSPKDSEFAGSFVNVPHMSHEHGKEKVIKTNLGVSLTEILEDLDAEDDEYVLVTLVPRTGCDNTTVGGLQINLD